MTLSPVFRSAAAVRLLDEHGIWQRFAPALARQLAAVRTVQGDLEGVIGAPYRQEPEASRSRGEEGARN